MVEGAGEVDVDLDSKVGGGIGVDGRGEELPQAAEIKIFLRIGDEEASAVLSRLQPVWTSASTTVVASFSSISSSIVNIFSSHSIVSFAVSTDFNSQIVISMASSIPFALIASAAESATDSNTASLLSRASRVAFSFFSAVLAWRIEQSEIGKSQTC